MFLLIRNEFPGYPSNPDSQILESDYADREFKEIEFSNLRIGEFPAYDYFGDGSFYLLDTPGHAIGHLCGLARTTTNPDTFILLGGDVCHYQGVMRPSPQLPLREYQRTQYLRGHETTAADFDRCLDSRQHRTKSSHKGQSFPASMSGSCIRRIANNKRPAERSNLVRSMFWTRRPTCYEDRPKTSRPRLPRRCVCDHST